VHPQYERSKLGITEQHLKEHGDDDSPLTFWHVTCPPGCLLRQAALRILCGKASALGVERLWSAARLTLTDNRRSLATTRLMQLMQCKMNLSLLNDSSLLHSLGARVLDDDFEFDSIFDDIVHYEEQEIAQKLAELDDGGTCQVEDECGISTDVEETPVVEDFDLFEV
jgi:hypothetical protein